MRRRTLGDKVRRCQVTDINIQTLSRTLFCLSLTHPPTQRYLHTGGAHTSRRGEGGVTRSRERRHYLDEKALGTVARANTDTAQPPFNGDYTAEGLA